MEAKRIRKKKFGIVIQIGLDDHLYRYTLRIYGTIVLLRYDICISMPARML